GNVPVSVTTVNVAVTAADSTRYRTDAVVVNSSGTVSVTAGTLYDLGYAPPPDTTGYALLAYVTVVPSGDPNYTGTITTAMIADQRAFALIHASPYRVASQWYGPQSAGHSLAWSDQDMYLTPFFTGVQFDI